MIKTLFVALASTYAIALPAWILFRVVVARRAAANGAHVDTRREWLLFLFVAYAVAVAVATVLPLRNSDGGVAEINIVPFQTIALCVVETFQTPSDLVTHCIANFVGNIALFFPFGLLAPLLFAGLLPLKRLILVALALSVGIELIQLIEGAIGGIRSVDIDDVMLNVLGAYSGYLALSLIRPRLFPGPIAPGTARK